MARPVAFPLAATLACACLAGPARAEGEKEIATYRSGAFPVVRDDGTVLLTTGPGAVVIDPATGTRTKVAPYGVRPEDVTYVMPSADGKAMLVSEKAPRGERRPVSLFSVETGKEIGTGKGEGGPIAHPFRAALSPDGRRVAYTRLDDNRIIVLDLKTGKSAGVDQPANGKFIAPVFSGDGKRLAAVTFQGDKLVVWNTEKWDVARTIGGENEYVEVFAMSQDGKLVAGLVEQPRARTWAIRVWNLETGKEVWSVPAPKNTGSAREPLSCVAFGKKGEVLIVGTPAEVLLYDSGSGQPLGSVGAATLRDMRRSEAGVKPIQLSLSPDGKRLAVTYRTDPATTKLYDISGLKAK